ncbi:MAG: NAD-dependent epimerase/dehydratase family protein [bacterium]|nr:NAD-dependent epimerase/dehydratase family protein [bacterium]
MNYLVTGGFGFIGSAIALKLTGNVTIVSQSKKHSHRIASSDFKILYKRVGKLTKKDLKDIDVIYHCASTVDNFTVLETPYKDVDVNIKETIYLLELCKEMKKKPKIVYLSTFFVYGNQYSVDKKPLSEESKTNPLSLYPATKLCTESILELYSRLYNIPYTICRLTNIYGPTDLATNKKGVINFFVKRALEGKPLTVYEGGNFCRDYIYIDDAVRAIMLTAKQKDWGTYLVGSGTSILFIDMISIIHKVTSSKSDIVSIPTPLFHHVVSVGDFEADISKLKSLGWKPKINHVQAINKIVNHMKSSIK